MLTFSRFGLACIGFAVIAPAHAAFGPSTSHPQLPLWDAAAINGMCEPKLADFRKMKSEMEAKKTSQGIFDEFNRLAIAQRDLNGPLSIIANTSPDKATREASDACALKQAPFNTELFQSEAIYRRVKDAKTIDAIQRQYRQDLVEQFEDRGVTLPADKRERVKAINQELTNLSLQFAKAIRDDDTKVVFTPAEMAGLPDSYLKAQKRDEQGNYVLPLANPSYLPFVQLASNEEARKRYWLARQMQGQRGNIDILNQAVALRLELGKLYGYPDFATLVVKRRMAATPEAVYKFLDDVKAAVGEVEKRELDELRQAKADDVGQAVAQVKLNRWDVPYYQERVKKARFDIDQEELRKYFPTEASIAYTLKVAETLYGVHFVPSSAPTWHPDVRVVDVYDRKVDGHDGAGLGKFVGSFYLDLFPRDGKYTHAAAWPVRQVSTLARQAGSPGYRTPISVLVTNLNRAGLNQDEFRTLMHEFGHVLHGVLSKARFADEAGTAVKRDFVEAPSQMFEEWSRREEPLKLFAEVCKDCPQLSTDQIDRLNAAHRYGQGIAYARQWFYASYDLSLTNAHPKDALEAWSTLEAGTPLGTVPGTLGPASFTHLLSGYAAGYYGYMWSEVLALDMLSGFHGQLMNPTDGRRYRDVILARGGEQPPDQLVERFLGRKPSSEAFFEEITGRR